MGKAGKAAPLMVAADSFEFSFRPPLADPPGNYANFFLAFLLGHRQLAHILGIVKQPKIFTARDWGPALMCA